MRRAVLMAVTAAFLSTPFAALADDTGFAYMHSLRKERGRTCMTDHFHSGIGTGPNKRAALKAAIRSWYEYTALEYGSDWARWRRSASKGVNYTKEASGYSASVQSRPCRR